MESYHPWKLITDAGSIRGIDLIKVYLKYKFQKMQNIIFIQGSFKK